MGCGTSMYIFDDFLNIWRGICVDLFDILDAGKVGQDDASIFFDDLYDGTTVVEIDSTSHSVFSE